MPKVTLVDYTGCGHVDPIYAARMLAFAKNTRMKMSPDGLAAFFAKPEQEIIDEINYMATSIPSSFEFADVTFLIEDVSRATAQQITRSRHASFAMQSQRIMDLSDVDWQHRGGDFDELMVQHISDYSEQLRQGMSLEDARDLLPIGVYCNLLEKFNLRTMVELVASRTGLRVQGPYREVVTQMKAQVLRVWPWTAVFFESKYAKAVAMIEEVAKELSDHGGGAMYKGLSGKLAKAADLVRKGG